MASNDSRQAEQQETYRNLPLDQARALVMAEIERCKDLLKTPPKTKDGLRTLRNQYKNWRTYTATLLYPKIFSTDKLAQQFAPIFDEFGWAGAPDTPRALQYDLNQGLRRLESIYECLDLYLQKPRQTTRIQDGPTANTQTRGKVFKRLKDAHPEWSQKRVAIEASKPEELGEVVTSDTVRNVYRAMGWKWERADRIR